MFNLNETQNEWLLTVYNKAYQTSNDNAFSIRFTSKIYQVSRLNPNFESIDGSFVGIAALPRDMEGVDVFNAEEALTYLLDRDLDVYIQSQGNVDSIVDDVEIIEPIEEQINSKLFGDGETFTDLTSEEGRLKTAIKSNDDTDLKEIISSLSANRVTQRNKVIEHAS